MLKRNRAKNLTLTPEILARKAARAQTMGFPKQKWIEFSETLLKEGYTITLYEARETVSKYLTVRRTGCKPFLVRFSNNLPNASREANHDCDFFVGHSHAGITNTTMALAAVRQHFGQRNQPA